jgi:hypothetical protein
MRRTIVLLAAIAAMVVVYAGTALAEDALDAHYSLDGTEPTYSGFNQNYKQGQTFTVENTGHLTKAEINVNRGFDTGATLYMEIVSVNASGLPTDNVLASASLPAAEISTFNGVETFTFDNPAIVRAGKQYAFVMHGGNTTTYSFGLAGDSFNGSPGYPGGKGYWLNNDYTELQEIRDHLFAIYVAPGDFPDVTGPVLSLPDDITQEAEGSGGATVSWSATATDDVDASVTVTCASDSGLESGDMFPLGTTKVTCSATDAANNTTSGSFNVTATDTTAPTASLTAPASGATVWGTQVTLSASASDEVGVTKVEFLVDGQVADTDTTAPYSTSWDSTTVSDGNKTIQAKAYDAANNEMLSSSVNVIVDNTTAPSVSTTTPTSGKTGVSRTKPGIKATFSEPVDKATVVTTPLAINPLAGTSTTVKLINMATGKPVGATVSCDADPCKKVTITPKKEALAANTKHRATVTTGVEDQAGNALDQNPTTTGNQPKNWTFTTRR